MERYLGGDVHAASVTFSVLNESGKQLRRDVVETNGQALVGYLKQQPGNLHLCIEEGEWSQRLYEILSPHVAELVVYRGRLEKADISTLEKTGHLYFARTRAGKVARPVFLRRGAAR